MTLTVDAEPLDLLGEMLAHLDGHMTASLERQTGKTAPPGAYCLWHREPWQIDSDKPPRGTLHADHRCPGRARP